MTDYRSLQIVAEAAARSVGKKLSEAMYSPETVEVNFKSDETDLVTNFDLWSEEQIVKHIRSHYPDHAIIG